MEVTPEFEKLKEMLKLAFFNGQQGVTLIVKRLGIG